MTSLEEWYTIKNLEADAYRHGMRVTQSQYGKKLALIPKDDIESLPGYNTKDELCSGTAEELLLFIRGWDANRYYLERLGLSSDAKIKMAESLILQRYTIDKLCKG